MNAEAIQLLAATAAVLAGVAAVMVVGLHVIRTEVDPRTDGVSAYALTGLGTVYSVQVVITGGGACS